MNRRDREVPKASKAEEVARLQGRCTGNGLRAMNLPEPARPVTRRGARNRTGPSQGTGRRRRGRSGATTLERWTWQRAAAPGERKAASSRRLLRHRVVRSPGALSCGGPKGAAGSKRSDAQRSRSHAQAEHAGWGASWDVGHSEPFLLHALLAPRKRRTLERGYLRLVRAADGSHVGDGT